MIALCACGGAATNAVPDSPPAKRSAKSHAEPRAGVDIIATLAEPLSEVSWIAPGPAQLVLGGASLQAIEGAPRLQVGVLEEQGNDVRVGVRLVHARFAVWMSRARMLAIITRDQRVATPGAPIAIGSDPMQVVLRRGAQVQRLARKDGKTQVRYVGAIDVEGWIPDDAISDRAAPGREQRGRAPTGRKPLMLIAGSVIRVEPRWAAHELAVTNQTYVVDVIQPIDDAWSEVSYEDGDVAVHGFVSKRDPPGRTHRRKPPEPTAPLTPNATVGDGTCLHVAGEEVGFIVGDQPAIVETSRVGWSTVTIDSPWGPIAFDVKGSTETELAKCGG